MDFLRPLAGLLLLSGCASPAALEVEDDAGRTVRLEQPARRIISLAPHATELLFAAGAGARMIAATAYSDYPPEAGTLPRIGDAARLDRERLLLLEPDLVVAWPSGNQDRDLAWLEQRGITLYFSEPSELTDIADNLLDLGTLAGSRATAAKAADDFLLGLERIRARYRDHGETRVFVQVWPRPLITVGAGHFILQAVALCGGRTPFPQLSTPSASVSREAVIRADPDAILATVAPGDKDDPFAAWRRWAELKALRTGRLIRVSADFMSRPTPRLLQGARQACAQLHTAEYR